MKRLRSLALLLVLAWTGQATAAPGTENAPYNAAQVALFDSNHLHAINEPLRLQYSWRQTVPTERFADAITLDVQPRPDGRKDVRVNFLTGGHHMEFPPALGFNGNPVLMFFLEHDVAEMHDATGGSTTYFRNRIRRAFADRPIMKPTSISFHGTQASATEITLAPYQDDPMIARFEQFKDKTYRFVLSDAVPGTIYEISTTVPDESGQTPRAEETMTFSGIHACQGDRECEGPGAPSP